MPNPTPISPQQHAGKFWKPAKNYLFAKKQATIPLISVELRQAVIDMPVTFTEKGGLAALLGFKRDDNVFINQEGKDVPTLLRTYPFTMARASENKTTIPERK